MWIVTIPIESFVAPFSMASALRPAFHFSDSSIAGLLCSLTTNGRPQRRLGFVFMVLFRGVTSVGYESDRLPLSLPTTATTTRGR